jgi:hypothetical protein
VKRKYIILTKHAEERLKQRNIKLEQIKHAIYEPHIRLPAWGNKKRVMRDFGTRSLDVIYRETENTIILITAMWLKDKERFSDVKN